MVTDLVPKSFWEFPSSRFLPSLWGEDEDSWFDTKSPSGLSVSEDEKNVYVEAALPGIDPDKIEVTYEKGALWIRGQTTEEDKDQKRKYYRRSSQSFSYRVAVPGEIDTNTEPQATCKNGVMKVTFAKSLSSMPKKIKIRSE